MMIEDFACIEHLLRLRHLTHEILNTPLYIHMYWVHSPQFLFIRKQINHETFDSIWMALKFIWSPVIEKCCKQCLSVCQFSTQRISCFIELVFVHIWINQDFYWFLSMELNFSPSHCYLSTFPQVICLVLYEWSMRLVRKEYLFSIGLVSIAVNKIYEN